MTKEEALAAGFQWLDEPVKAADGTDSLPDDSAFVSDEILQKTFTCTLTNKPFRLTKAELDFYRSRKIPLPRVTPIERILERAKILAIKPLQQISCSQCSLPLESIYNPATQPILCETCYQNSL